MHGSKYQVPNREANVFAVVLVVHIANTSVLVTDNAFFPVLLVCTFFLIV